MSIKKNLDLQKPNSEPDFYSSNFEVEHSTALVPTDPKGNQLYDPSTDIFALPLNETPLEERDIHKYLLPDGLHKVTDKKIFKKGSKIGTEFTSSNLNNGSEVREKPDFFVGRKGATSWSKNVKDLRKKFGFSPRKFAQKLAIFGLLATIIGTVLVTSVAVVAINMWEQTESIDDLETKPAQSSIVYARDGTTKIFEFYDEEKRELIEDINEVPKVMQLAVIALEDENFYENQRKDSWQKGIPWQNIAGATFQCMVASGDRCRGASGISQQLIKNMTGDDQYDLDRKARELFRAMKLNKERNVEEILKAYLNLVPFGKNAYGVQEASKTYFGRPVNARDANGNFLLTPPEACYLASIINQPSYYQNGVNSVPQANKRKYELTTQQPQAAPAVEGQAPAAAPAAPEIPQSAIDLENRKDECLIKLATLNLPIEQTDSEGKKVLGVDGLPLITEGTYIKDKQELEILRAKPVIVTSSQEEANAARGEGKIAFVNSVIEDPFPHFREYVTQELNKIVDPRALNRNGYEIITTLDPALQREMEQIVKDKESLVQSVGGDNASAVILDGPSGQILSMVGSFDYGRADIDGKVNVSTSPQQPGSSIKPYVYMAAFKNGFNPGTVITDVKTTWGGWTPKNFDGNFRGPVTMRRALQGSLNIPAVKSLFLVNDEPQWDEQSKLNDFFNFVEDLGLNFPCIDGAYNPTFPGEVERCRPDPVAGITQQDIDRAYRARCGIATALGGCEVTMISHVGAMNTIFQDGKQTPATPFISIKEKNGDKKDVYAEKQASEKPAYPNRPATEELTLLSRQMTNVMSDYEARAADFGSTRFNLELNDKRWRVAAKTGTTDGPRDFWTIGGSPYHTVAVWAGRTDNGVLSSSASSGITVALLWKDIMERMHTGKEVKNFNNEGLTPSVVGGGVVKGKDGQPDKKVGGYNEVLTPKQLEERYNKGGRVVINTPQQLEAFKQSNIFQNRTTLIPASYTVNKMDGGLFVPGKTLEQNKEEKECTLLISEFPSVPSWQEPVSLLAQNSNTFCNLPPPSNQDQLADVNQEAAITTNIQTGKNTVSQITLSAAFPVNSSKKISEVSILRNGTVVAQGAGNTINTPIDASYLKGSFTITLQAKDNLGKAFSKTISGASFTAVNNNLTIEDISSFACSPAGAVIGSTVNCSFSIPEKTYKTLTVKIGSAASKSCSENAANLVSCSSVSVPAAAGTYPVSLLIDGTPHSTGQNIVVGAVAAN